MLLRSTIGIVLLTLLISGCSSLRVISSVSPTGSGETRRDISFGGHELKLDVYKPEADQIGVPPRQVIMFVYGGDPSNVFVMGHSAGGEIAALLHYDESYLQKAGTQQRYLDNTVKPRNSAKLAERVTAAGGQAQLIIVPERQHASIVLSLARPLSWLAPVADDVNAFIRTHACAAG